MQVLNLRLVNLWVLNLRLVNLWVLNLRLHIQFAHIRLVFRLLNLKQFAHIRTHFRAGVLSLLAVTFSRIY